MKTIAQIMVTDFSRLTCDQGLRQVMPAFDHAGVDALPVWANQEIAGVLRQKDVLRAHPNRLVADAMRGKPVVLSETESFWKAHDAYEDASADLVLVRRSSQFVGIVPRTVVRLESQSHWDPSTNLFRTGYVTYRAMEFIRNEGLVSVAFFDIDRFGRLNKKWGHSVGDAVLTEVAGLLDAGRPASSTLGRVGGDEFVLVSSGNLSDLQLWVRQKLSEVAGHAFPHGLRVGISAGLAGGEAVSVREGFTHRDLVRHWFNQASLASTRAKHESEHLCMDDE